MMHPVGAWIDHHQAILVFVSGAGETLEVIRSNVERQQRRDGSRVSTHDEPIPADGKGQRAHRARLNEYYDRVLNRSPDRYAAFILGSGRAKYELSARVNRARTRGRIVAMETADKMSEHEVAVRAKRYFQTESGSVRTG